MQDEKEEYFQDMNRQRWHEIIPFDGRGDFFSAAGLTA
jgi:hypothetical protein